MGNMMIHGNILCFVEFYEGKSSINSLFDDSYVFGYVHDESTFRILPELNKYNIQTKRMVDNRLST